MKQFNHIFSIIFTTLVVAGCGNTDKNNTPNTEEPVVLDNRILVTRAQFDQSSMKLGKLEERSFPEIVKTTGVIDVPPQNRAVVSAIAGGIVKNTSLLIGDKIKKGQALLTIENPEFITIQQEYLEVKEQLTYLKSEYERQQKLFNEKITSQKKFLKAESDYKTAQAMYNGLRKRLILLNISPNKAENGTITSVATIFAPISGSITKMGITKGMHVSPMTELLEIIDNEHIHLELFVFEKDIMKIKKGQKIEFKIPETSDKSFDGKVYLIGTSIDENRTIRVHGHLNEEIKHKFLTGMFVNAQIMTKSKLAKALPETSIVEVEDKYYVLRLESKDDNNYYFNKIEVKKGNSYDNFSELLNPSISNDSSEFLTQGAFSLITD